MKSTKQTLKRLMEAIVEEIDRNPDFADRIHAILQGAKPSSPPRSNRRAPGVLDPFNILKEGEEVLRERLGRLTVEELKDIVAEHRMDPSKLVMKWRDEGRIVDHIVTTSMTRAKKGDAFLQPAGSSPKGPDK